MAKGRDTGQTVVAAIVLMAFAVAVAVIGPAWAQSGNRGDGHAENHDWYRTLKTKSGWSCCSGDEGHGDCRPVLAHQRQDGEWEAYFSGAWQEIPRRCHPARRAEQGAIARPYLRARGLRLLLPERRRGHLTGRSSVATRTIFRKDAQQLSVAMPI